MSGIELLKQLVGEQLSAVTFVQDYIQLWFDGPGINVTNPLSVGENESIVCTGESGFRDALCNQISKSLIDIELKTGKELLLIFNDKSSLSISLRAEDYSSPEAFYAHGFKGGASVAA